ncbi:GAF domain-containing protein [Phytophthora cinnamomi]|uniref:GAF domain-containing protein n=1 Tax=Phytophthora cinnamomi TaxID=4785 RepID=UPI00355A8374|nr:GAF domain-containing protein [Phytophthora cinnamomi]
MPFRTTRRSPTLDESYVSNADTSASSPQDSTRKVLVDDQELLFRVRNAPLAVALKRALTDPVDSWDCIKSTPCIRLGPLRSGDDTFELSSRANDDGYEVLAVGSIACSPQELVSVLCSRNENDYNAAMKGMYASQFIYGSVVHILDGKQSQGAMPDGHQLTVRTGCFARSRMLARNEQWCFLEYFQPTSDAGTNSVSPPDTSQGFSVALLSLPEKEIAVGKANGGRVDQIDGVTALLVVDTEPNISGDEGATKLRVMFHALYKGNEEPAPGQATDKMSRIRLQGLAAGIPRLPAVVRRRRLGTQVFAHQAVTTEMQKSEAQNTRCISCTKGLRLSALMRVARRCQLCAYNVCTSCWSRENVETYNGHLSAMGVCKRCLEWIDRCDYSHVQIGGCGPVEITDDPVPSECSAPRSNKGQQSLREDLAVESTKSAAVNVIKMLLDPSKAATETTYSSNSDAESTDSEEDENEEKYMSAVGEYFERRAREAPEAKDCVLSNAQQRTYPLHPMDKSSPSAPLPENETARLECIAKFGLMDLKEPIPELDIICSFLGKELGFFCTMITIVGDTHQLILSCTIRDFIQALLPREHTFCQHLLMGNAPFIIKNPQADVRFYNLNPVTRQGVKYYCGIPITGPGEIMVGSICCVHNAPMDITRSQYDTLVRFGEIASKIIRVKAGANQQKS